MQPQQIGIHSVIRSIRKGKNTEVFKATVGRNTYLKYMLKPEHLKSIRTAAYGHPALFNVKGVSHDAAFVDFAEFPNPCEYSNTELFVSIARLAEAVSYLGMTGLCPEIILKSKDGLVVCPDLDFLTGGIYQAPGTPSVAFSLGMILFENYFGATRLWQDEQVSELLLAGVRPEFPADSSFSLIRLLIERCWSLNSPSLPDVARLLRVLEVRKLNLEATVIPQVITQTPRPQLQMADLTGILSDDLSVKCSMSISKLTVIPTGRIVFKVSLPGGEEAGLYRDNDQNVRSVVGKCCPTAGAISVGLTGAVSDAKEYLTRQLGFNNVTHDNIVESLGIYEDEQGRIFLIREGDEECTLSAQLHNPQIAISSKTSLGLLLQIARGLEAVHQAGYIYRDLKCYNILLFKNGAVKLITPDSIKLEKSDNDLTPACGTLGWMAPEVMSSKDYSTPADVFSFGCVIYEIYSRHKNPAPRLTDTHAIDEVTVKRRMACSNPPIQIWELFRSCCNIEPSKRPRIGAIIDELEKLYARV